MNYLEQYYKNLCEQLQSQINLIEKQIDDAQVTNPADLSPEEQRQQRVSTQVHNYAKRRGQSTTPVDYGSEGPVMTRDGKPLGKETVKNVYTGDKFAISHSTQGVPDQEEIGPADGPSQDYEPVSTGEDAEAEYKRVQASKAKALQGLKEHRNLEQYYRNLYEQLQSQINLIEKRFDISKFKKSKKGDKKDDKKSGKKADKKSDKDYDGDGEVESSKDEYFGSKDKAIKKSIADKKKKKNLKEGREISGGQFTYGGFPRILNEEINDVEAYDRGAEPPAGPELTHQDHMQTIFQPWQGMQRDGSNFDASKFRRAMMEFGNGNLNYADDLLKFGASPTAVAGVVKTSGAHHAERKAKQPSPEDAGYGAPGSGVRYTGD